MLLNSAFEQLQKAGQKQRNAVYVTELLIPELSNGKLATK